MTGICRLVSLARIGGLLVVLCVAAAGTVALAQHSTTAAFTGQTVDTGNSATSAASFCAVPGGTTLDVTNDTYVDQADPATPRGGATSLRVAAGSGAIAHTYLRFSLPTLQPHCTITGATLRLYATSSQGPGTILVHRASTTWSSATNTWNTVPRPAPAGTGVGHAAGTAGWHEWTVTTLTRELYAGTNDGFLVKDAVETNPARATAYESLDSPTVANRPELVVTWG
jgi:hypothetical protein